MSKLEGRLGARAYEQEVWDRERIVQGLVLSSGKMVLIDKLLPKLKREGHKVSSGKMVLIDKLLPKLNREGHKVSSGQDGPHRQAPPEAQAGGPQGGLLPVACCLPACLLLASIVACCGLPAVLGVRLDI